MALGPAGGGRGRRQAFLRCVLVASIGLVFPQSSFVPPGKVGRILSAWPLLVVEPQAQVCKCASAEELAA